MIGAFAFIVFAVASMAQLVVGSLLDRSVPRPVFMGVRRSNWCSLRLMPGQFDGLALAIALGFMLGAFGQIPINDFMIGKMAAGEFRARVYGVRYVVSFTALATIVAAHRFRLRALGLRHAVPGADSVGAGDPGCGQLPAATFASAGTGARTGRIASIRSRVDSVLPPTA